MIGPGIRGIKLPIIPTKHRIIPVITKKISINCHKITKYKSEFFVNSTFMRLFICITVSFLFVGCDTSISKSKIIISNDQISWKNNDEFPSINYCDQFKLNSERFNCFKNKLSELILDTFDFESVSVFESLNDTIKLYILVNKKGEISLLDKKINKLIKNQIPSIELILDSAITKLPTVLPAIKTSLGVEVDSKFELPLILKTN